MMDITSNHQPSHLQQNRNREAQVAIANCDAPLDRRTPSCAQPSSKLYVLLLNGNAPCVNGAQVSVMEETDEEGFGCLLQRLNCLTLPSVGSVFSRGLLADFPYLNHQTSVYLSPNVSAYSY